MNKNLVGRVLMVGALAFTVACQQPAAPAAGSGSGAAAEGTAAEGTAAAAEGTAAEGTAAEASAAPAAEEGTAAAPAPGSGAAAEVPAAGSGAAAAAPAPRAPTGEPVAAAAAENLHGAWNADIAGMLAAEAANMAPEELAMMQALMGSMQITFTFNADGTAAMAMSGMGQAETKAGTYAITGTTGNQVMFTLTETPADGSAPAPENFTATFQTTNNMTLTKDGDPQVIPFYRQ